MPNSICGVDCNGCQSKETCSGCAKTSGQPFQSECIIAKCCQNNGYEYCNECSDISCKLKEEVIAEFNALGVENMSEVTNLNALKGSYINLTYTFPSGQIVKVLDDNKIYLGNQICKLGSDRCYGLAADESNLLVCEYGECGTDPEIIMYKKRKL